MQKQKYTCCERTFKTEKELKKHKETAPETLYQCGAEELWADA
jgi:hypothetical protein